MFLDDKAIAGGGLCRPGGFGGAREITLGAVGGEPVLLLGLNVRHVGPGFLRSLNSRMP